MKSGLRIGSTKHEQILHQKMAEMKANGWAVIELHGKSPDALGFRNGKFVAIEALTKEIGHKAEYAIKGKKAVYWMFDDIFFVFYEKEKRERLTTSTPHPRIKFKEKTFKEMWNPEPSSP